MPLKINVGLTKKIGQPDFGSRGANVSFEVELEANLVREPEQLREKIKYLFKVARQAVEEELDSGQPAGNNGREKGDSNGHPRQSNGRSATASQIRALHAIATREGIDLAAELHSRYGVDWPDDLAISQASDLIDALKAPLNGSGGRR